MNKIKRIIKFLKLEIISIISVFSITRFSLLVSEGPPSLFWPVNGLIICILTFAESIYEKIFLFMTCCPFIAISQFHIQEPIFALKVALASSMEILVSYLLLCYLIENGNTIFLTYDFILKLIISVCTVSCLIGASIGSYFVFSEFKNFGIEYSNTWIDWFIGDITGNFITLYTFYSVKKSLHLLKLSVIKTINIYKLEVVYLLLLFTLIFVYFIRKIDLTISICLVLLTTPLTASLGILFPNIVSSLFNLVLILSISYCTSNQRGPIYRIFQGFSERDIFISVEMVLLITFFISYLFSVSRNDSITKQKNLSKLIDEKDVFFSHISHELRTPLNIIYGYTESLINHPNKNDTENDLNEIMKSCMSLKSTVDDLLMIFQGGKGKINVSINRIILQDFLHSILDSLQLLCEKNIVITFEIKDNIQYIYSDNIRLKQVILNICSNSIKYTHNGYIKIIVYKKDTSLIFSIEDTGIGIEKKNLDKIFDRFFRCNDIFADGNGLGLSICKIICKYLDGDISVISEFGKGSTFYLTLNSSLDIPEIHERDERVLTSEYDMSSYSILIVEDSIPNYKILNRILKLDGYKTNHIDNGIYVDNEIKNNHYDVILLDLGLPGKNGIEVLQEIKTNLETKDIVVIIVSAEVSLKTRELCIKKGCNGFIDKPFNEINIRMIIKDKIEQNL